MNEYCPKSSNMSEGWERGQIPGEHQPSKTLRLYMKWLSIFNNFDKKDSKSCRPKENSKESATESATQQRRPYAGMFNWRTTGFLH